MYDIVGVADLCGSSLRLSFLDIFCQAGFHVFCIVLLGSVLFCCFLRRGTTPKKPVLKKRLEP